MEVTEKQIEDWKKKHGDVFEIIVEDKKCYLHKPSRKTLAFALTKVNTDPLSFAEIIISNCWLAGDDEIKENDDYFMAASTQLDKLMEVKTAQIKKL